MRAGARGWLTCSIPARRPRGRGVRPARDAARRRRPADLLLAAGRVQLPRGDPDRAGAVPLRPHAAAGDARRPAAPARRPQLHWEAEEASWDAYREQASRDAPLELRGVIDLPGRPAARVGARALLHRPRRRRGALRRQGRDQAPGVSFDAAALLDWYERVRRPLPWRAHARPLRAAGLRGDAPADPGGAGRAVLRGVPGALPRPRPRSPRAPAARRARGLERPRLQPPRAGAAARPRARSPSAAGRRTSRAAGRRRLHGRRGRPRSPGTARPRPSTPTCGA